LEKLEDLNCSKNVYDYFKVGGLTGVNKMEDLIVDGCSNLKYLDCDLNDLNDLDFSHLTNLRQISVRQNNLSQFFYTDKDGQEQSFIEEPFFDAELVLNSPFLEMIDCKHSNTKKIVYRTPVDNQKGLKVIDNFDDEGYDSGRESNDEFAENHQDSPTH
jgi:Leucine-rich repeat (LRR) protein